ncbi:MAG TPA: hypothetical protein VF881_19090 [Polyangiaceae bacterium]
MGRAKAKAAKIEKAKIVGDPIIDSADKRIVYSIDVGGMQGNAWEYKDTGEAALAVVNFNAEIHSAKRGLIWSAVNEWRAANRDKYAGLLKQL